MLSEKTQLPNVVFLFSDQQRFDTLSCYGEPLGKHFSLTPNLDRLANEGSLFYESFSCQPVCGPARACIQTGKYPSQIGCQINDTMLPLREHGIARYFKDAGYNTAYVGKWHLASHRSFADPPASDTLNYKTSAVPMELRGGYEDFWIASDVLEFTSHGYGGHMFDGYGNKRTFTEYRADATTNFALEFLKQQQNNNKPFFLFVSYIEPHHQNDKGRFEGPHDSQNRFGDFPVPGDLVGTDGDWASQMPDYLGCCANLDKNVGRIVEELSQQGILDNTLIIYTSDHSCHFRTRNSEYKRSCHDNSIRVPFVARGPGFMGGRHIKQLSSMIDIAPTLLTAADIEVPHDMPGIPLQQLAEHPEIAIRDEVFVQISESCVGRALRNKEFTYSVEMPITEEERDKCVSDIYLGKWEGNPMASPGSNIYKEAMLYDLTNDPFQKHNLIDDERYVEVRKTLRGRLARIILSEEDRPVEIIPFEKNC